MKKTTITRAIVAIAAAAAMSATVLAGTAMATETQTMYRLYNPNSGEHFYTADANERAATIGAGWNDEGTAWVAPKSSSTPVHRLYSGTDHHYTMDAGEKDALIACGWSYEGIGWYSDDAKGVPLYRQFNPNVDPGAPTNNSGSHNYTTSKAEHDSLVAGGWKGEGVAWYGCKAPASNAPGTGGSGSGGSGNGASPQPPSTGTADDYGRCPSWQDGKHIFCAIPAGAKGVHICRCGETFATSRELDDHKMQMIAEQEAWYREHNVPMEEWVFSGHAYATYDVTEGATGICFCGAERFN